MSPFLMNGDIMSQASQATDDRKRAGRPLDTAFYLGANGSGPFSPSSVILTTGRSALRYHF